MILLLIIIAVTFWSFISGNAIKEDLPSINALSGILLIIIGLLAGLIGGIIGTGGCSVMLPILHFWLGLPTPIAIGTTLFAVIFTAISGGYGHIIRRNVDKKTIVWLSIFGLIGVTLRFLAFCSTFISRCNIRANSRFCFSLASNSTYMGKF